MRINVLVSCLIGLSACGVGVLSHEGGAGEELESPSDDDGVPSDVDGTPSDVDGPHLDDDEEDGDDGPGPTPVVGDCDGLGGVDEFQNITPPGVTMVLHVLVDEVNSGTIYVGTMMQGIYRSQDCGASWVKINTGVNGEIADTGGQWSMQLDPKFPNVIYAGHLYGSNNSLFKSTNGGVDWVSLAPPGSEIATTVSYNWMQEVSINPDKDMHEHLVISFHADCKGAYAKHCMAETFDGGDTWRLFKGPLHTWGENARPMIINETTFLFVTWADGLFFTTNNGATWERGGDGGNHQMYRASTGVYYMGTAWGVASSSDGLHWTQIPSSPGGSDGLVGDGERIFTGLRDTNAAQQPFFVTDEADGVHWESYPSPPMAHGAVTLKYDKGHNLLYAAGLEAGLWRIVTK